jgi:hypothetical protein
VTRWLFLTVPGFVISAVLLAFTIRSLLRTLSAAAVLSVPVEQSRTFDLTVPGPYDLYVQGRLGTMDFRGLAYELTTAAGGNVPMEPVIVLATTTSMSGRVKLLVRSFVIAEPGAFTLRITGLRSEAAPDNRLVISRPVRARMVMHILGLVALGSLTIGSLVASVLVVVLPGRAARS